MCNNHAAHGDAAGKAYYATYYHNTQIPFYSKIVPVHNIFASTAEAMEELLLVAVLVPVLSVLLLVVVLALVTVVGWKFWTRCALMPTLSLP